MSVRSLLSSLIGVTQQNIPVIPAYSMIHSVHASFQIVIYSCTHNTQLPPLIIHANNAVKLILSNDMVVMWDEVLFRSGSKLREIITHHTQVVAKEAMTLFDYI